MVSVPNVAFAVTLRNIGGSPVIRMVDTTVYGAAPTTLAGYYEVTQPDGITVSSGSFGSPSSVWDGSQVTATEIALRLANDGTFQNGMYTVKYYQRITGFDDTTTTRTFTIAYARPTMVLQPAFDLFTPQLRIVDSTSYAVPGFGYLCVTRSWTGSAAGVGNVAAGGNAYDYNLAIAGKYYDALYSATLTAVAQYELTGNTWVTLIDTLTATTQEDAHAVAAPNTLMGLLNTMFDNLQGGKCGNEADYALANTLFNHFMQRGRCGQTSTLYEMYRTLRLTIDPVWAIATHTQAELTAYDFDDFCGCCDTGGGGGGIGGKQTFTGGNGLMWTAPAGTMITAIVFADSIANVGIDFPYFINVGTALAASNLVSGWQVYQEGDSIVINKYCPANTGIYIDGLPGTTQIIIYYS